MNADAYVRSIERAWGEFTGRPVILSPKDWALVEDWHARGIPLALVEQAIEAAVERRTGGKPRGLSYLSTAVEEGWSVVREARPRPGDPAPEAPESRNPREFWRDRAAEEPEGSELRVLLEDLLARAAAGEDPVELDLELDARVVEAVPELLSRAVREEILAEVEPFRGRMGQAQFDSTIERAEAQRVRFRLNLPRLAGTKQTGNPAEPGNV